MEPYQRQNDTQFKNTFFVNEYGVPINFIVTDVSSANCK